MPVSDNIRHPLPIPTNIDALIFDFDGTLVNSEPVWDEVFMDVYEDDYNCEVTHEQKTKTIGGGVLNSIRLLNSEFGLPVDDATVAVIAEKIELEVGRRVLEEVPVQDGGIDLILWARNRGIRTAICTASGADFIHQYLAHRNIALLFDVIYSARELASDRQKPHPRPYRECLATLDVPPESAVAIEDSINGVMSSISAGIATFAMPHEILKAQIAQLNPTALVPGFREVLALLSGEQQ